MEDSTRTMELFQRRLLAINGVETVEAFDENKVLLKTKLGLLAIKGEGMAVKTLDLDAGRLEVEGLISGWEYQEDKGAKMREKGRSVFSRLVR